MKVLLVRADSTPDDDRRALEASGADVTADAYITVAPASDAAAADRARCLLVALAGPGAWLILTSAAGIRALDALVGSTVVRGALVNAQDAGGRFAAVGPASAAALTAHGVDDVVMPVGAHTASALLELLDTYVPSVAVLPRSSIGGELLPHTLAAHGWTVVSHVVYDTATVASRPSSADLLAGGHFDAVVLRSPSAARAVAHFVGKLPSTTAVIAGGPTTASQARRLGLRVTHVAADSRPESIAAAVLAGVDPVAAH